MNDVDFSDTVYNLKIPFIEKKETSIEEKTLYEMLDLPILDRRPDLDFPKVNDSIKDVSQLLKLNYSIEMAEDAKIGHALRVAYLTKRICDELNLSEQMKKNIYLAAIFHDVGKIRVPNDIISKKGKLTDEEFALIKRHCFFASECIDDKLPKEVIEIIEKHHERIDGSGYPLGIKLDNIGAMILGLVDSYDAMTSNRVYKDSKSITEAFLELNLCSLKKEEGGKGLLYNPKLVELLKRIILERNLDND